MRDGHKLTDADFRAADAVLARENGPPAQAPHDELRNFYATLHARFGADKFALRFGLREPATAAEELEVLFFGQQITEGEYKKRVKDYATRSVDKPMLEKFFSEYEAALNEYAEVLQLIVAIATDQHQQDIWQSREQEVNAAIAKLDAKFDLFSTELMTVFEFLTQVQADREAPIKCGEYTGDSAHWIATLAISHASEVWKNCKEIAHRTRSNPAYLYSTNASALFFTTCIESGKLPRPNDLAALMRGERAKALAKFHERAVRAQPAGGKLARMVQPVHFEDFSGHQFERLVFAYHLRTEQWRTLEWYGQSGGDLGRDIWGVLATGESLCIQCVNRKATTAIKITRDLDKIVRARGGVPDAVLVVCSSSVSAKLRDKVKDHAQKKGISRCDIWSGQEFEERLRRDAEGLLRRFIDGEAFPDDPEALRRLIDSKAVGDDLVVDRIIRVFDRPAFCTPFRRESSLPGFRQAIGDTIQALNTGIWQTREGKEIERLPSRHEVTSEALRNELADIVRDLTELRAQFEQFIRDGEIRPCGCKDPSCPVFFFSPTAAHKMDSLRSAIMTRVHGLPRLTGRPPYPSTQTLTVVGSNNSGIIANQVTIRGARPRPHIIIPGSIGADPNKYNYVEYLIKRLTELRSAGASYGQRHHGRVHPGSTRKILEKQLGGLPKDLPEQRFSEVVAHVQQRIDDTAVGRNNRKHGVPSYHSFEEHITSGVRTS